MSSNLVDVTYNGNKIIDSLEIATNPTIIYNSSTIATLSAGDSKTLSTSNKIMNSNLTIADKNLSCANKLMNSNVVVSCTAKASTYLSLFYLNKSAYNGLGTWTHSGAGAYYPSDRANSSSTNILATTTNSVNLSNYKYICIYTRIELGCGGNRLAAFARIGSTEIAQIAPYSTFDYKWILTPISSTASGQFSHVWHWNHSSWRNRGGINTEVNAIYCNWSDGMDDDLSGYTKAIILTDETDTSKITTYLNTYYPM